jgi:hypothetical protein
LHSRCPTAEPLDAYEVDDANEAKLVRRRRFRWEHTESSEVAEPAALQHRRRHSANVKVAVIRECLKPGVSIAAVALTHDRVRIRPAALLHRDRESECPFRVGTRDSLPKVALPTPDNSHSA